MISLEQLEKLMEETGAGYELCSAALKANDGDYAKAKETVYKIREEGRTGSQEGNFAEGAYSSSGDKENWEDTVDAEYQEVGEEEENESSLSFSQFWETCKNVLEKVNATNLVVRKDGKVILNISMMVGAIGVILAPLAALFGLGAAFVTQYEVVIILEDGREINILKKAKDEAQNVQRDWEYYASSKEGDEEVIHVEEVKSSEHSSCTCEDSSDSSEKGSCCCEDSSDSSGKDSCGCEGSSDSSEKDSCCCEDDKDSSEDSCC